MASSAFQGRPHRPQRDQRQTPQVRLPHAHPRSGRGCCSGSLEGPRGPPQPWGAGWEGRAKECAERTVRKFLLPEDKVPQHRRLVDSRQGLETAASWGGAGPRGASHPPRLSGAGRGPTPERGTCEQGGRTQLGRETGGLGCRAEEQCGLGWALLPLAGEVSDTCDCDRCWPPLGLRRLGALLGPALNWMTSGVAALPAHLVQRASFWPCDSGRTGTRRPAETRADFPRGPQDGRPECQHPACRRWPARSILSCPSDVHVREPSSGGQQPSPAHPWVTVGPGRGRHPGLRWYPWGALGSLVNINGLSTRQVMCAPSGSLTCSCSRPVSPPRRCPSLPTQVGASRTRRGPRTLGSGLGDLQAQGLAPTSLSSS